MGSSDFIITIHALVRFRERFPELARGVSDRGQGEFIHREVMDALDNGRHASILPIELTSYGSRWDPGVPGSYFVWTKDKMRGYAIQEHPEEGMLVKTVLVGRNRKMAMKKLQSRKT